MSSKSLLIQQARILLPEGIFFLGDVWIEGGKIAQIASEISGASPSTIIDDRGLTLLPGVIDPPYFFR